MNVSDAVSRLNPVVAKRLRANENDVRDLTKAYVSAAIEAAVYTTVAGDLPPTTMPAARQVLVERLADELQRVPSVTEVAALLRVPDSTARTLINQVLAMSDGAAGFALASVFRRAVKGDRTGGGGAIPHGQLWRFRTREDLGLARRELERTGIKFSTQSRSDGNYVLVVDPSFAP